MTASKWAALEALVGDPKRIALVAADLFEKRPEAMDGKAMIVCMSRRICVDLYNALIKLRPEWAEGSDVAWLSKGESLKVGNSQNSALESQATAGARTILNLLISSPKAAFFATVMCGHSA